MQVTIDKLDPDVNIVMKLSEAKLLNALLGKISLARVGDFIGHDSGHIIDDTYNVNSKLYNILADAIEDY